MRENEVRTQVSGARSAQNDPGLISSAVKHTPLTETLCPVPSSLGACSAAIVMRRFSPRCSMRVIFPTSSTMPVNINASEAQHHNSPRSHRDTEKPNELKRFFSMPLCLRGECVLNPHTDPANIPPPQSPPQTGGDARASPAPPGSDAESHARRERNRTSSGKNLRCVIQEN